MPTYFCSDPHAFHGNIIKFCRRLSFLTDADREAFLELEAGGGDLRAFKVSDESTDNMNRGLAANINARVGPDDTLWCLGDWAWGNGAAYLRNARWFRDQIAAAPSTSSGATTTAARSGTSSPRPTSRCRSGSRG